MTIRHNKTLGQLSYWAVGGVSAASEVAIRLNGLPAILMNADAARDIAAALISEADAGSTVQPVPFRQRAKGSAAAG